MDCETFRLQITQDPARRDELADHAADCPACAAFAARVDQTEQLVVRALTFDVEAVRESRLQETRVAMSRAVTMTAGLAAAVVAAVMLWVVMDTSPELAPSELAAAVIEHYSHEPESLAPTTASVAADRLVSVLAGRAVFDPAVIEVVRYARICNIGGRRVPHLVIQGQSGPFMVVLLPDRVLETEIPLESRADGLAGSILPAGNGSIAVVGEGAEELDEIGVMVSAAVSWTI